MTKEEIFNIYVETIKEVLPELENHEFKRADNLIDLGANSIDRVEIIVLTLEALAIDMPMVELAGAQNIGDIVNKLYAKVSGTV